MQPHRRHFVVELMKLFDLLVVSAGLLAAGTLTAGGGLREFLGIQASLGELGLFLAFLLVSHTAFEFLGFYDSRRLSRHQVDWSETCLAVGLGAVVLYFGAKVFRVPEVTALFVLTYAVVAVVAIVAIRALLRLVLRRLRMRGRNLRYVAVVGANERTLAFAERLCERPELGYEVIGFVDDPWVGAEDLGRFKRLASLSTFPAFLREVVVDEVIVGLPMKSFYGEAAEIVDRCEEQGVLVRFLSSLFEVSPRPTRTDVFAEEMVVSISQRRMHGWPVAVKRLLDIVGSALLIALLWPVMLAAAIATKFGDGGPIYFVQKRVGLNKRLFPLIKFRTMVTDAEKRMAEVEHLNEVSGAAFKVKDDPRITPVGRFLRRSSIDELPQLFNVLRGDMSLVGPRPLPVRDFEKFEEDWQRRRFSVRPGITCLWQVGGRSGIAFDRWMELDMEYIDQWSLLLDLKILARTLPAVMKGSGAA